MGKILVAFDLYGTLLSTASIAKQLASHFGEEKADSVAALWRRYQLEYTWRLNSMKQYQDFSQVTRNSLKHALREHKLTLNDEEVEKLMQAYDSLSIFPDVATTLESLSASVDIDCVVFTNGTKAMATASVQKSPELSPHNSTFTQIISVDSVRSFKPAPETYDYLAQCTGMNEDVGSMWLVSGNPFDVVGARAFGMQAAWVDRAGNGWQDSLGGEPTVVVNSLDQVAAAVYEHAQSKS